MTNIKNICVFASASNDIEEIYYQAAIDLGRIIAENHYNLVYGGSHRGLMFACANSAKKNGSKIYGVMPKIFSNIGLANPEDCEEFYITEGMRERKAKLDEISDAVIATAGGFGTLEELSEMIVQKQLGYNNKPIVILDTNNFYRHLIEFFNETISKNFAPADSDTLYYITSSPQDAVNYIKNYVPATRAPKYVTK